MFAGIGAVSLFVALLELQYYDYVHFRADAGKSE